MIAVPAETPDTTPDVFTVATDVAPLDHTPPAVRFDNVIVDPTHTLDAPVMAPATGKGFTNTP
jgi:hypothetical protein